MTRTRGHATPLVAVIAALALAGCSGLVERQPAPTPTDFGGVVIKLGAAGVFVQNPTSGDAGCADQNLIPTAIRFEATGPGLTTPVLLRVYIFGDRASWERRRPDVDTCAAAWATDPATFETVDSSPYVVAGQGPWPAPFKTAIQAALLAAAGNGG